MEDCMISLKKIKTSDCFHRYPQLKTIWQEPFNEIMQEAYLEDMEKSKEHVNLDFGDFYYIKKNNEIIGITGYFVLSDEDLILPYNEKTSSIYLRWHGIIEKERNKGYSKKALNLLVEKALLKYPGLNYITELVPQTEYGKSIIEPHFKKIGFEKYGKLEKYDWIDCYWQPYRFSVVPKLNIKSNLLNFK